LPLLSIVWPKQLDKKETGGEREREEKKLKAFRFKRK
jgi:hypothetical protein